MLKIKYSEVTNFTFAQAIQKLAATPTDAKSACRIRKVTRGVTDARKAIADEYQEAIVKKFGKKDEAGNVIKTSESQHGFDPEEGKDKEIEEALKAFGAKEAQIDCFPLSLNEMKEVKLSAQEIEALGEFFVEEGTYGPGVPQNVTALR